MNRSRAIDILRALAVFLVLGYHMDRCPARVSPLLNRLTDIWATGGWIGVDLFFVLSGFLVSGLLFREYAKHGDISVARFLIRRGFKIYPAFWLMILVSLAVLVGRHEPFKPLAVPGELLFIQNYAPALWNHTWSLAVEEHFYLFLVLLLFGLLKIRRGPQPFRLVPVVFGALALTCLGLRLACLHFLPAYIDKLQMYPTHLRMDSLFAGVALSYFYHNRTAPFLAWARRWRWGLLVTGLLLLLPAFCIVVQTAPWMYTFGLTLFFLGSGALLTALLTATIPDRWLPKALAFVGSHSYSIYLWHMPISRWVVPLVAGAVKTERNWFVYFAVYFLGAIVFGILMASAIEIPLLRLRDRWFPSAGRPLSTA